VLLTRSNGRAFATWCSGPLLHRAERTIVAGIARQIFVSEGTVEKHVRSILTMLDLPEHDDDHRRVLAVITFLDTL
jgi:hypothetical protein